MNQLGEGRSRNHEKGVVYVIDSQENCQFELQFQLEGAGYHVKSYLSPESFLEGFCDTNLGCIIVDYRTPSSSGKELLSDLRERGCHLPFIVVTRHATVSLAVKLMQMGATTVLEKPCSQEQLVCCVEKALAIDSKERQSSEQTTLIRQRLARLTRREKGVLGRVQEGHSTKQIAAELNISIKTVEVHRSNVTRKMEVDTMMQLLQLLAIAKTNLGRAIF